MNNFDEELNEIFDSSAENTDIIFNTNATTNSNTVANSGTTVNANTNTTVDANTAVNANSSANARTATNAHIYAHTYANINAGVATNSTTASAITGNNYTNEYDDIEIVTADYEFHGDVVIIPKSARNATSTFTQSIRTNFRPTTNKTI